MEFPEKHGSEFRVNPLTEHDQLNTATCALDNCRFAVAWNENEQGVFVRLFDCEQTPITDKIQVEGATCNHIPTNLAMTTLDDGNFVVTWFCFFPGDTGRGQIKAQKFNSNAIPIGENLVISGGYFATYPRPRVNTSNTHEGGFITVYECPVGVEIRIYDKDGLRTFSTQINAPENCYPNVITLHNGNHLITYHNANQNFRGNVFDVASLQLGSEFEISMFGGEQRTLQALPMTNGNFIVFYSDSLNYSAQVFSSSGTKIGTPYVIDSCSTSFPKIKPLNEDYFIYIASQEPLGNFSLYGKIFTTSLELTRSFSIFQDSNYYLQDLDVAVLTNGEYVVSFLVENQTNGEKDILAQIYYGLSTPLILNQYRSFRYFESIPKSLADFSIHTAPTRFVNASLTLSDYQAGMLTTNAVSTATIEYDFLSSTWRATFGTAIDVSSLLEALIFEPSAHYRKDITMSVKIEDEFYTYPNVSASIPIRINKAPVITKNFLPITEGETVIFSEEQLAATDPDPEDNDSLIQFKISELRAGKFEINSITVGQFYQQNITSGVVKFTHDGSETSPYYKVTATDGYDDSLPEPVAVLFFPVIDAPRFVNNRFTITEGEWLRLNSSHLSATDEGQTPDSELFFEAFNVTHGVFSFQQTQNISFFFQQDIFANSIYFLHDNSRFSPHFNMTVSNSVFESEPTPANIIFSRKNDAILDRYEITINEGQTIILSPDNFNSYDDDLETSAAELIFYLRDVTHGQFELAANPGSAIMQFSQEQVDSDEIQFVHDGSDFAPSFSVMLTDGEPGGEFINGNVNFTSLNDLPLLLNKTISLQESEEITLSIDNFSAFDPDNADSELSFIISNLQNGQFENIESPGIPISNFTLQNIKENKIIFKHNGGEIAPSFFVAVSDGEHTTTPLAADILFFQKNDAPQVLNCQLSINEKQSMLISTLNISVNDPDNSAEELIIVVTNVSRGQFENIENPNVPTVSFSYQDLLSSKIKFIHDGSEYPPTFSVTVRDSEFSSATLPAAITFNRVNDIPRLITNRIKISEAETIFITPENLRATDDDFDDNYLVFKITNLEHGFFSHVDDPETLITQFTQEQIKANEIQFTHDGSESAPIFKITVTDGASDSPTAYPFVQFLQKNDLPVLLRNSLLIKESRSITLTTENILATDVDTPDSTLTFLISDISNGQFEHKDSPNIPINEFLLADIQNQKIIFVHDGSELSPSYKIAVYDGVDSTNYFAATIFFEHTNNPPQLLRNYLSITEGESKTLTEHNLIATDRDHNDADLIFSVANLMHGFFSHINNISHPLMEFQQRLIQEQKIQFTHDDSILPPAYKISVSDSFNQTAFFSAQIEFRRRNDMRILANRLTISEGERIQITPANLAATDPDSEIADQNIIFYLQNVRQGYFSHQNSLTTPLIQISQQQIADGKIYFTHDGGEIAPSINVFVSDGQPGAQSQPAVIEFTRIDDPPRLEVNSLTIEEGEKVILTTFDLAITDVDTLDTEIYFTATEVLHGFFALASLPKVPICQFTQAQIKNSEIVFVHDGCEVAPSYVINAVSNNYIIPPNNANITFVSVNDLPIILNPIESLELTSGESFSIDVSNIFHDIEDQDDELTLFLALANEASEQIITQRGSLRIPETIYLDAETKTITGFAEGNDYMEYKVIALDSQGGISSASFSVRSTLPDYTSIKTLIGGGITGVVGVGFYLFRRHLQTKELKRAEAATSETKVEKNLTATVEKLLQHHLRLDFLRNKIDGLNENRGNNYRGFIKNLIAEFNSIGFYFSDTNMRIESHLDLLIYCTRTIITNDIQMNQIQSLDILNSRTHFYIEQITQLFTYERTTIKALTHTFANEIYQRLSQIMQEVCINSNSKIGCEFLETIEVIMLSLVNLGFDLTALNDDETRGIFLGILAENIRRKVLPTVWSKYWFFGNKTIMPSDIKKNIDAIVKAIAIQISNSDHSRRNFLNQTNFATAFQVQYVEDQGNEVMRSNPLSRVL